MPGFPTRAEAANCSGIWSRHHEDITFDQLQKFWSELHPQKRKNLLRIDKQTLFEQARKNLYCSRCNGLLLEGFSQIITYGKSLQQEAGGEANRSNKICFSDVQKNEESNDIQDPSVHPWGGLVATREGMLTILECFMNTKSLITIQNVFDSARARERERELLYPDACGEGGRGWISQGMACYGRGHATRETCALHTARLSVDTLVDFWSALSDETRLSLLRMKEEDFIERLMYRFDSKRFCRDCRRNVIREFKELKELKRIRREPRCTSWFCVADTAFQYEVSEDTVLADWNQSFTDTAGTYHHFEWAIGTSESKYDILDFENVGMSGQVQLNGLDLGGLTACFITLRAWKLDGRCTELSVKAHALKGQLCAHRRLVVGDGFVTITNTHNIRAFFEHAEEAEEEEDDDTLDKDGNDYDGDGSRPQKHAKSPELAREFLLDAATVIFKEQVEKAFREGTSRQNAHSIFVCLALKLLEERIHVACKEIITLEKQYKLLEEEEKEKCEEEQRKERRRTKEREKKLRRKERIKGKEMERARNLVESTPFHFDPEIQENGLPPSMQDESASSLDSGDSISDTGDSVLAHPLSPSVIVEHASNVYLNKETDCLQYNCHADAVMDSRDGHESFMLQQSKSSRQKLKFTTDLPQDPASEWNEKWHFAVDNEDYLLDDCGGHRVLRGNLKSNSRSCTTKFKNRIRCDFISCGCNQHVNYRGNVNNCSTTRSIRERKNFGKREFSDTPKRIYRNINGTIHKLKLVGVPSVNKKQVWEPMDAWKKCAKNNSDPDITLRTASEIDFSNENTENVDKDCLPDVTLLDQAGGCCPSLLIDNLQKENVFDSYPFHQDPSNQADQTGNFCSITKCKDLGEDNTRENIHSCAPLSFNGTDICVARMCSSPSDNCSSCHSEVDSGASSSSTQLADCSSTSDSEDACQNSEGRENPTCNGSSFPPIKDDAVEDKSKTIKSSNCMGQSSVVSLPLMHTQDCLSITEHAPRNQTLGNTGIVFDAAFRPPHLLAVHDQNMHLPVFSSPMNGYHDQSAVTWSAAPDDGYMHFPHHNHCAFPSPAGYGGVRTNSPRDFCLSYAPAHPSLVYGMQQIPPCQSFKGTAPLSTKDHTWNFDVCEAAKHIHEIGVAPKRRIPSKKPFLNGYSKTSLPLQDVKIRDHKHAEKSFSLFHFDGPFVPSAGCNANPAVSGHIGLQQELKVEEYSLFSANNGTRFSFF